MNDYLKSPLMACWSNKDPRFVVGKRADIVIVRRHAGVLESSFAWVETNHGYSINTHFDAPYDVVLEGDDWDEDWYWTFVPLEVVAE